MAERRTYRCAVYTRKSTEYGLEQDFNSLDAQREACEAYIKSQAHEGWRLLPAFYDDGGVSGATLERPALQALLADVKARKVDVIVVYKVDRLTRSLADFAKLVYDDAGNRMTPTNSQKGPARYRYYLSASLEPRCCGPAWINLPCRSNPCRRRSRRGRSREDANAP